MTHKMNQSIVHHHAGNKRKRGDDVMMSRISNEMMCRVFSFALSNHIVTQCRDKRFTRLFPDSWYISLVRENKELMKLLMLNEELFHVLFERFFMDALNMIDLFQFFGFYVVKDMEKWLHDHEDEYETNLPFAVIPLVSATVKTISFGDYYLKSDYPRSMREDIIFQCTNKKLKSRYNFHVFDNGAKFVPLHDVTGHAMGGGNNVSTMNAHAYCNSDSVYNIKVLPKSSNSLYGFSYSPDDGQVMPISSFVELYQRQSKLRESEDYDFSVGYQASRPVLIVGSKPQKETPIDNLSQATYYSMDDITGAVQVDSLEKKKNVMRSLINLTNQAKDSMVGGKDKSSVDGILIRNFIHDKYQHSDYSDGMIVLPESMEVLHAGQATKVLDTENLERKLELAICEVMRIPYQVVKPLSNIVSSSSNSKMSGIASESQFAVYDKLFDKEIKRQQILVNRILHEVYSKTYAVLDNTIFYHTMERQKRKDDKKNKKRKRGSEVPSPYYPSPANNYGVRARIIFPETAIYTNEALKLLIDAQKEGTQDASFITKRIKMNAGDDVKTSSSSSTTRT